MVAARGARWSYRTVAEKVDCVARNLALAGITKGDVVSAQLPNWAEFLVIHLAATRLGAVTNPLLPIYRGKELTYILGLARSKVAFLPNTFRGFNYTDLYREFRPKLPALEHLYVIGDECPDDMLPFEGLLKDPPVGTAQLKPVKHDGNDITILMFTSGTELVPKGVMHSHNTLMFTNTTITNTHGLTADEVFWCPSPISHATGIEWGMRQAIVLGGTLILQEIWDAETALDLIENERCTFTTGATPFASMLLELPTLDRRDLSSFRTFVCGGATIPRQLGEDLFKRTGCTLIPVWGMSECFAATTATRDDPSDKKWGTDGRAIAGAECVIFDDERKKVLPAGEVGEIGTRGPHVCLGYFKDAERTKDTFSPDGWLFSNDLGTMDERGFLRVVGRKKDIINRGGLKVSAREVEDLLLQHPSVLAVAVVGVPDARLGEKSCAFVVPRAGETPTLADLVAFLERRGLAKYKLPEFASIVAEFPMTPTGKIQKFKLRDGFVDGTYKAG